MDEPTISTSWHSYPSSFALGHAALAELLLDPVLVEEKVDGSQFSFGLFEEGDGSSERPFGTRLRVRSKGAEMIVDAPEKMFQAAVDTVKRLEPRLVRGWTYRGEFLAKPKHNALVYDRVPAGHIILFDINTGHESYLSYDNKLAVAADLGLEVVPRLYEGRITDLAFFRQFLEATSVLGGQKVEGVVVKSYTRFGRDKKILIGKFVSEAFKETHSKVWKAENPNSGDMVERLIESYHSQARWTKAIQHLREAGKLTDAPQDIGLLMREIPEDVRLECEAEIKDTLFAWAWPKIARGITAGMPQWYKEVLLAKQFETLPTGQEMDAETPAA